MKHTRENKDRHDDNAISHYKNECYYYSSSLAADADTNAFPVKYYASKRKYLIKTNGSAKRYEKAIHVNDDGDDRLRKPRRAFTLIMI